MWSKVVQSVGGRSKRKVRRRLIPRSERSGELLVKGGSPVLKKEEFAGRGVS